MWRRRWLARRARREHARGTVPRDTTIRSKHAWVTANGGGLVIRRRTGLSGWLPICSLPWTDIDAMEFDTVLYAWTRSSRIRTPLMDRTHLNAEQWVLLRDSVAAWTGHAVWIDLAAGPRPHP